MTFKTSLFKKGLIRSDLKLFWWTGALYTLLLLFFLPFEFLMQGSAVNNQWVKGLFQRTLYLADGSNGIQMVLILVIPVAIAALLFRYMQATRSTAVMHSFPCSRLELFCSHSLSGIILITVPVFITGLALIILQPITFLKEYYTVADALNWMGLTLLFDVLFYASAIFVGMFTGSSIAQIVFTYIFHILPGGIYALASYNLESMVYGFSSTSYNQIFLENNLPIFTLLNGYLIREHFTPWHAAGYLCIAVVLLVGAGFFYRARKLEAATDIITFSAFRPVFKYGVAFCCMLVVGGYLSQISQRSVPATVLGYFIGSLLGYWIAEMLMQKSLRVWRAYKGYLTYAGILTLIVAGLTLDVLGYERRVPGPGDVEKVYIGYDINAWMHYEKLKNAAETGIESPGGGFLTTKENIENTIILHRQLIQVRGRKDSPSHYIAYTLKNGSHLVRQYAYLDQDFSPALKPLYESTEYKNSRFPIMVQKLENIKWIEIRDDRTSRRPLMLSSESDIKDLTARLKAEINQMSYQEMASQDNSYATITVMGRDNKSIPYSLKKDFSSVYDWLKEKGYYDTIMVSPKDIESVVLQNFDARQSITGPVQEASIKTAEIKEPPLLEELMNICSKSPEYSKKGTIAVNFRIKEGSGVFSYEAYLSQDTEVSDALRVYMKQVQ